MTLKSKLFSSVVYIYIALPFIIFAAGFLKLPIAIITVACMAASLVLAVKSSQTQFLLTFRKRDIFKIGTALLFIISIVLLSGIGDVLWQNNDHATRNTIFDILVDYSWPPQDDTGSGMVGLVYYIGFWLPSAVVGKLSGLSTGYIFTIVWACAGLFILWFLLCLVHKKLVVYPLVIFMLFSGLDIVGHTIVPYLFDDISKLQIGQWAFSKGSSFTYHLEWWARYFQYSSHTTQLFWVFNQSLPVWIATVLLILEKNNKNLVFIMGVTLLSSTLPFIGLIPIFVWCAVTNHNDDVLQRSFTPDPLKSFTSLFTFQNVIGGGISGIISFLYLRGNIASETTASQTSSGAKASFSVLLFIGCLALGIVLFVLLKRITKGKAPVLYLLPVLPLAYLIAKLPEYKVIYYVLFIVFEVLIIAAAVFPLYGTSTLYALTISCLLIIPFFIVGRSIDFCMRASIPLLVVLCLFVTTALEKYMAEKKRLASLILTAIICVGMVNSMHEIARTVEASAYENSQNGRIRNDSKSFEAVFKGKNFTGKIDDNIFYEILAKEKRD